MIKFKPDIKPLVKWAGGKTQLLNEIIPMLPKEYNTYYEPFIGGGALYFALHPEKAVINDYNVQLINLYKQCRDNPNELLAHMDRLTEEHINSKEYFNSVRSKFNVCLKENELSIESAALLVYLNKSCFNGLYRLNSKGEFNTPSGHKEKVNLYDTKNFKDVSMTLKNATIMSGDFEKACENAKAGDFVFFDSPYYNTFDTYQAGGFSENDHKRLANLFKELTQKGVYCMLTNSNEDFIKELYKDYKIKVIQVKRMINCDEKNRKGVEIIVTNY